MIFSFNNKFLKRMQKYFLFEFKLTQKVSIRIEEISLQLKEQNQF